MPVGEAATTYGVLAVAPQVFVPMNVLGYLAGLVLETGEPTSPCLKPLEQAGQSAEP